MNEYIQRWKGYLTRKYGPLPGWVWAAMIVAAVIFYARRQQAETVGETEDESFVRSDVPLDYEPYESPNYYPGQVDSQPKPPKDKPRGNPCRRLNCPNGFHKQSTANGKRCKCVKNKQKVSNCNNKKCGKGQHKVKVGGKCECVRNSKQPKQPARARNFTGNRSFSGNGSYTRLPV